MPHDGMEINDAVQYATTNQNITPIEYQGKTYPSLTELAKHLNKHIVTLQNRIKKGWPEMLWSVDELPKTAPDFYFFLNNPEYDDGECSFYLVELQNYAGYIKAGIAKSYTHRADREYGNLIMEIRFKTRFKSVVFEQSLLHLTTNKAECPSELVETDPPWTGFTEVRKMSQESIETLTLNLENELHDIGLEAFAVKYIPMSQSQQIQLHESCSNQTK